MNWIEKNRPVVVLSIGFILGIILISYLEKQPKEQPKESGFCC